MRKPSLYTEHSCFQTTRRGENRPPCAEVEPLALAAFERQQVRQVNRLATLTSPFVYPEREWGVKQPLTILTRAPGAERSCADSEIKNFNHNGPTALPGRILVRRPLRPQCARFGVTPPPWPLEQRRGVKRHSRRGWTWLIFSFGAQGKPVESF